MIPFSKRHNLKTRHFTKQVFIFLLLSVLCSSRAFGNHATDLLTQNPIDSINYFLKFFGTILNFFALILIFLPLILIFFGSKFNFFCTKFNFFVTKLKVSDTELIFGTKLKFFGSKLNFLALS